MAADDEACSAVTELADAVACEAVVTAADGSVAACDYNAGLSAEVKKNLALNQPATQSSTGWGGLPGRAVDGNADTSYWGHSCMHSQGSPAWWQVDLGAPFPAAEEGRRQKLL